MLIHIIPVVHLSAMCRTAQSISELAWTGPATLPAVRAHITHYAPYRSAARVR